MSLISEKIKRKADLKYNGDINKASNEHFREYPEDWQRHTAEVTEVKKRAGEDPKVVNAEVEYQVQLHANAMGLDLNKQADRAVVIEKVCKKYPELFERQRQANRVHVGKVSLD